MKNAEVYQEEWCVTLQNTRQLNKNSVAGNTEKNIHVPMEKKTRGKESSETAWPWKSDLASCLRTEHVNERGVLSNVLSGKKLRTAEFLCETKWPSKPHSFLWEVAAQMFYHSIKFPKHVLASVVFNVLLEYCTWNSFCRLVAEMCAF